MKPLQPEQVGAVVLLRGLWFAIVGLTIYLQLALVPTGWCFDKGVAMTGSGVLSRVNFWYRVPCSELPASRRGWPEGRAPDQVTGWPE